MLSLLSRRDIPLILKIQSYRTPVLDVYFQIASFLGEEIFWIILLVSFAWLISLRLAIDATFLVCAAITSGNYLKNIFCIPRPSAHVWAPHKTDDYGFPSTHTISSCCIPPYIVFHYFYFHDCSECFMSVEAASVIAFIWSTSIIFSRLYNGAHSPSDIIAGFIIGCSIFAFWILKGRELLDLWIFEGVRNGIFFTFSLGVIILFIHPKPLKPNSTLGESAVLVGSAAAIVACFKVRILFEPLSPQIELSPLQESNVFLFHLFRILVGISFVFLVRMIFKKVYTKIFTKLMSSKDPSVAVKYMTYFTIGIAVTIILPIIFHQLSLQSNADRVTRLYY